MAKDWERGSAQLSLHNNRKIVANNATPRMREQPSIEKHKSRHAGDELVMVAVVLIAIFLIFGFTQGWIE